MPDETTTTEEVKVGSRHSAADNAHLQNAIEEILQAGGSHPRIQVETPEVTEIPLVPNKAITTETLISFGDEVKAVKMDDGSVRVTGYLVRFSDENSPDLTGDYFTAKTDFGEIDKADVYFNHCMPIEFHGKQVKYDEKIGRANLVQDEVGILADAIIYARNEYEKMLGEMALARKFGWSSGTAPHIVKREYTGKAYHIKRWTLRDDASLTPTPAEPRNSVIPLKSYLGDNTATPEPEGDPEAATAAESEGKDIAETIQPDKGVKTMDLTKEEIQNLLDTASENAVKKFRESEPATKSVNVEVVTDEADNALKGGWKYPGEFFQAVKNAALLPHSIDRRLLPLKDVKGGQGINEAIPSDGGFLVDQTIAPGIFERMYQQGTVLSQFAVDSIGPNSNGMTINTVAETSRADGSRWGGVRGYWLAEGGTITASHPTFSQVELKLKKVAALAYATDEQLEDTAYLGTWLNRVIPDELRFMVEDAILNGNGAGKPLGITQSPPFITEPRTAASLAALTAAEIAAVWSRRWVGARDYIWLVDQSVLPGMMGLTIGNFPVFMPANGIQGTPASTIFGRPVFEVEYLPTVAATTGHMGLLLISPSQYAAIDKSGIQGASSIHVSFATDETAFRFVYRIDGKPMWSSTLTPHSGGETVSPFVALGSTSS